MPKVEEVSQTLGTLITWMAQSANSPISPQEAGQLLKGLNVTRSELAGRLRTMAHDCMDLAGDLFRAADELDKKDKADRPAKEMKTANTEIDDG